MTIEFECGNCGKKLATPDSKAGKTGKCPDCGEPVTVPQPQAAVEEDDPFDFNFEDQAGTLPPRVAGRSAQSCPMCGAKVASADEACPACGEILETGGAYSAAAGGEFSTGHKIDAGQVLSLAWERYQQQMGLAIGGTLLWWIANFGGSFIIGFMIGALVGGEGAGILAQILGGIYGVWLGLGFCIFMLAIARGERADVAMIFSGGPYFLRGVLANFVYYLGIGVLVGLFAALTGGLAAAIGPVAILIVLPIALLVIIRVVLMYCWLQYVLVDTDAPGISCLQKSSELMPGNYGAVILIALAAIALFILGALMCGVGLIFTGPLAALMFATAYDQLSGGNRSRPDDDY